MDSKFTILDSKNTRALNFIVDVILPNITNTVLYFIAAAFISFNFAGKKWFLKITLYLLNSILFL